MIIGVDGFPVSGPRTGVGRYVAELIKAVAAHERVRVAMEWIGTTADVTDLRVSGAEIRYPSRMLDKAFYARRIGPPLPYDVKIGKVDAMVFTRYVRFPMRQDVPVLSLVYDFSFVHAPETIDEGGAEALQGAVPALIAGSDYVGVISHAMARECLELFPGSREKLVVIEPGASTGLIEADATESLARIRELGLSPGYFLFVGSVEPRKNLLSLIRAISQLPPDVSAARPLVVAGGPGWKNEEVLRAIESLSGRVRHLPPFVSDATLKALYLHAAALVFPSRYEGFGLPILEAMHLGTPVLCSDIPVFREVAADAALYFDHADPDDIASTMTRFIEEQGPLRDAMVSEGRERASSYCWDASARRVVDVLRSGTIPEQAAAPSVPAATVERQQKIPRGSHLRLAIVSTPRSGNTWLRTILAEALDAESIAIHHPHDVPWEELPERSVLQLHWYPEDDLLESLETHGFDVCTLVRHPCAVMLSILQFAKSATETGRWLARRGGTEETLVDATPTSSEFLRYVTSDRAGVLLGVSPAWARMSRGSVVRYEDLVEDPVGSLQELSSRLQIDLGSVAGAVQQASIDQMRRKHPTRAFHFWHGEADAWKGMVPAEVALEIASRHPSAMQVGGYEVNDRELPLPLEAERNWHAATAAKLRDEVTVLRRELDRVQSYAQTLSEQVNTLSRGGSEEARFVADHGLGMRSLEAARRIKRARELLFPH